MTHLKLRDLISGDLYEVPPDQTVYIPEAGVEPPTDGNLEGTDGLTATTLGEVAATHRVVWLVDEQETDGVKLAWPTQLGVSRIISRCAPSA